MAYYRGQIQCIRYEHHAVRGLCDLLYLAMTEQSLDELNKLHQERMLMGISLDIFSVLQYKTELYFPGLFYKCFY